MKNLVVLDHHHDGSIPAHPSEPLIIFRGSCGLCLHRDHDELKRNGKNDDNINILAGWRLAYALDDTVIRRGKGVPGNNLRSGKRNTITPMVPLTAPYRSTCTYRCACINAVHTVSVLHDVKLIPGGIRPATVFATVWSANPCHQQHARKRRTGKDAQNTTHRRSFKKDVVLRPYTI